MARVFISFLGTGKYAECTYKYENKSVTTKYIQSALLKILYSEFTLDDRIKIFLTDGARKQHWEPESGDGLKAELEGLSEIIDEIDVPDGKSEQELWEIFSKIYEEINDGDNVIFDTTHGFRSLPIFGMTVLNYAHCLKNISIEGIYYGAFEAKNENNEVPIFNLSASFDLMQWANAADMFNNYGIAEKFTNLSKNQNDEFSSTKKLSESILKMTKNLKYSRGKRITEGSIFKKCIDEINDYKDSEELKRNPALVPILDSVIDKIEGFQVNKDSLNFLPAVQWYMNHDMPAEAISMMKEGIITYLMEKEYFNYKDTPLRLILGQRLSFSSNAEFLYNEKNEKFRESVETIMNNPLAKRLKPIVERFNSLRNDIDHCGFDEQARNPDKIQKEIENSFDEICKIFSDSGEIDFK